MQKKENSFYICIRFKRSEVVGKIVACSNAVSSRKDEIEGSQNQESKHKEEMAAWSNAVSSLKDEIDGHKTGSPNIKERWQSGRMRRS